MIVSRESMKLTSMLFAVAVLLPGPYLFAQSSENPKKLGSVAVRGSIRTRVEGWDWFQDPGYENTYVFPGTLIRLSLNQQREAFDWNLELAAPVLLNLPDNAVAPAPQGQLGLGGTYFASNHGSQNTAMVFPKQAYIRFKRLGGKEGQSLVNPQISLHTERLARNLLALDNRVLQHRVNVSAFQSANLSSLVSPLAEVLFHPRSVPHLDDEDDLHHHAC